jgi:hypothetical protein
MKEKCVFLAPEIARETPDGYRLSWFFLALFLLSWLLDIACLALLWVADVVRTLGLFAMGRLLVRFPVMNWLNGFVSLVMVGFVVRLVMVFHVCPPYDLDI